MLSKGTKKYVRMSCQGSPSNRGLKNPVAPAIPPQCFYYLAIYSVSNAKKPMRAMSFFFGCAVWNPMGNFSWVSN